MNRRQFLGATSATLAATFLGRYSPLACGELGRTATSQTKPSDILKRAILSTGEQLPAVGLGTWQAFMPPDPSDANALTPLEEVLKIFFDLGGRLVDTAPAYGHAEQVVGTLAKKLGITNDLFIATKVSAGGSDEASQQMN